MKKRVVFSIVLLLFLTTIISKQKSLISKLNIKEIRIKNNSLVKEAEIKKLLKPVYNKIFYF